jgi:hypothetical protein
MKIAMFNINNINKRLHNLVAWLAKPQPDVVCLQELKAEQQAFPAGAHRDLGYPSATEGVTQIGGCGAGELPEGSRRAPCLLTERRPVNPKRRDWRRGFTPGIQLQRVFRVRQSQCQDDRLLP